jgi:predicted peroxiredoxin
MPEKKKILYVQTSGVDNPERSYTPFILDTTATMMGIDATVYFLVECVTLVKKGEADPVLCF